MTTDLEGSENVNLANINEFVAALLAALPPGGVASVTAGDSTIIVDNTDPANPLIESNNGLTAGKLLKVVGGTPSSLKYLNGAGNWVTFPSIPTINTDTLNLSYDNVPDFVSSSIAQSPPQQQWARIAGTNYVVSFTGQLQVEVDTTLTLILSNGGSSTRNYQVTVDVIRMFNGTTFDDSANFESGVVSIAGTSSATLAFAINGGNGGQLSVDGSGNIVLGGAIGPYPTYQMTYSIRDVS